MRIFFLAAVATIALTGATAIAQNTTSDNTNAPGAMTPAKTITQEVPAKGPNFVNLQSSDALSSNVVGLDVYNGENNNIGKIQDVAFDTSKKITGYILSVGGFLGMGTHYVAVDPSSVDVMYDSNNKIWRATMNATKDQLKAAPEFKYGGQWTASRS
jgi:sporulation protein YlmC with PRC-barrel domain